MRTDKRTENWIGVVLVLLLGLSGCGKFFTPGTSSSGSGSGSGGGSGSGSGSGTGSTADFVYVANEAQNLNTVAGFSLASGKLALSTNSPYIVGFPPNAMSITPSNSILYVGGIVAGGIYAYAVNGADGSLSLLNNNNPVVTGVSPAVLKVDPSGNWLIEADYSLGGVSAVVNLFQIDPSTGTLTSVANSQLALDAGTPASVTFTPSGQLIYVALGTGGVDIFAFNPLNGTIAKYNTLLQPRVTNDSDNSVAVDPAGKFLFVAETGINALRVLTINNNGSLAEVTGSPFATDLGPSSVLVDKTGAYVYVANRAGVSQGDISAFSLNATTGALTPLSGSPFVTGYAPVSLAEDNTKTYLAVACANGFPDLQVFTINATSGVLSPAFTATTGQDPTTASVVVATH